MGKVMGLVEKKVLRVVEATCDDCQKDTSGNWVDLSYQFSFDDNPKVYKTICLSCYMEKMRDMVLETEKKQFDQQLAHYRKSKEQLTKKEHEKGCTCATCLDEECRE